MSNTRDVMVVLLGAALVRMAADRLTVGQTADLLVRLLEREGYVIKKIEPQEK
jgi:hypothetical protein